MRFDWIRARIDHELYVSYGCSIMLDMKKAPYGTATPGALLKPTKIIGKDVFIITEKNNSVKFDTQSKLFNIDGPVPGSATEIALRNKTRHTEKLIDEMNDEFPQLKNIYEILKGAK